MALDWIIPYAHEHVVTVTTDANGAATAYTASYEVRGRILAIIYTKTDFSNGSTITITTERTGQNIWVETGVNASATRAPRLATHSTAGVAATYDGTYAVLDYVYACGERIKIVIASGGATKTGKFTFIMG